MASSSSPSASFRVAHIADLHLGYRSTTVTNKLGVNIREADGYLALKRVVESIIEARPDCVVIAGDVFHSATPEVRPILMAQHYLRLLGEKGIPVYILAGNHDTNDTRADIASSRLMDDPLRGITSIIEPYSGPLKLGDDVFLHMVSHHMYGEQHATMKSIKPVAGALNIFSTHGSIIDPLLKIKLHTEQSPREIVIPDFLLEDHEWSYTMLGHIHERGFVGTPDPSRDGNNKRIFYNGSLIRRGFSDKECALGRGWTEWSIAPDGTFTPTFHRVAQRPQVDLAAIDAEGMTPRAISDEIVANLKSTQVKGNSFDPNIAPLLRQKIMNLEPSKHASLDWGAINAHREHALAWSLKRVVDSPLDDPQDTLATPDITGGLPDSSDVVRIYDSWVTGASTLASAEDKLKETVQQQTREFVELGQEMMLNE